MRKIIIIAASLFTLTAAEAQDAAKPPDWWPNLLSIPGPSGELTTGFEAWRACVVAKAERFSKGSDPADLIVQAALVACKEARSRVVEELDKTKDKVSPEWITNNMEAVIKTDALLRVIELRAAK